MIKRFKYILATIVLSFFICTIDVSAEVTITSRESIKLDGKTVYKLYDNLSTGKTDIVGATGAIITMTIDGKTYTGYCVDFGVSISAGKSAQKLDMFDYYKNVLGEDEANKLVRKLVLYTSLGYGTTGKTTDKYYLATQQLIWQAISDSGFYESDFYKERSGAKYNIQNMGWTTDKTTRIDISAEINAIESSIRNYFVTPSFCSSQNKLEIEIGKTVTYTDNNNVLSKYEVSCDNGLTCQTDGNKLNVTGKNEASENKITFLKPSSGIENAIYRSGNDQGIVVDRGILEAVSCEFGVDTFKNEKTADMQIIYIVVIGLFCGTMAYITYYTKKSLGK